MYNPFAPNFFKYNQDDFSIFQFQIFFNFKLPLFFIIFQWDFFILNCSYFFFKSDFSYINCSLFLRRFIFTVYRKKKKKKTYANLICNHKYNFVEGIFKIRCESRVKRSHLEFFLVFLRHIRLSSLLYRISRTTFSAISVVRAFSRVCATTRNPAGKPVTARPH